MRYYRLWSDERGESHIEQVEVEWRGVEGYARDVPPVDLAEGLGSGAVHFSRLPKGWFGDWHPAPARQWVVLLQGRLEVTASDGVMQGGPGTAWLVEDTEGRGHQTRVIGEEDAIRLSVVLQ
jgi:hypothetical protein